MENFKPSFKERGTEQFYFNSGWIECGEDVISPLWQKWNSSTCPKRYEDEEGFLIFGYGTKEKQVTECYKFSDDMTTLKNKLIIGNEYLFSDMLQEGKTFKVEWKKGVLDKIERHPYSANCFVCGSRYFLYIKEI